MKPSGPITRRQATEQVVGYLQYEIENYTMEHLLDRYAYWQAELERAGDEDVLLSVVLEMFTKEVNKRTDAALRSWCGGNYVG